MNEIIIGLNNKVRGGMVDFKKFLNILQNQLDTQDSENDLIQEFSKLDGEGKGKIKESDLRKLMSDYENALTNKEMEEIMLDTDIDEDGYVDYVKFVKTLIGG
jgi:calmodulin